MHADSKQGRTKGASRNHIRIWAIYALAFLTPLMYRGSAEAARALGFGAITQLTVAYLAFAASGLTTWALVTRSPWAPIIAPITPPATPGLPNDLRNPLILLCAVSAVIATGLFVGPFGKDATSLPESASFAEDFDPRTPIVWLHGNGSAQPLLRCSRPGQPLARSTTWSQDQREWQSQQS